MPMLSLLRHFSPAATEKTSLPLFIYQKRLSSSSLFSFASPFLLVDALTLALPLSALALPREALFFCSFLKKFSQTKSIIGAETYAQCLKESSRKVS